ncbi:hypothetical protein BKA63DRAFT_518061 [Paraphoma chrysanthemicola]|nr:hypothetical protein BKA63DRAFT_518061 [Paraphoma chrysanthemicola]
MVARARSTANSFRLSPIKWLQDKGVSLVSFIAGLKQYAPPWYHGVQLFERAQLTFGDYWMLLLRLIALTILTVGLSFGAAQSYFAVGTSQVLGREVDTDLKLAFLGIFNKILDVMVLSSLEYTACLILTVWMTKPEKCATGTATRGVISDDFDLKDELTKPWMTLILFYNRWSRSDRTWKSFARLLLCLCVSISVILQGLAFNTIALPKERWHPDNSELGYKGLPARYENERTLKHPKTALQSVDWDNLLGVGQSSVGTEDHYPQDWAQALSASLSFSSLTHVVSTVARTRKDWQHVYEWQLNGDLIRRWVGLNTAIDRLSAVVETISADQDQVSGLYAWLKDVGHKPTTSSIGWTGNLTLVLPALNTLCVSEETSGPEDSFTVLVSSNNTSSNPVFDIRIGPAPSRNFAGTTCRVTFRQARFPVDFWQRDKGEPDLSFNNWGKLWNKSITYEPIRPYDHRILQALAVHVRETLPRMQALVQSDSLLNHFLLMSRKLQQADAAITSDAAGLSIIIGVLCQNMLSISNKHRSPFPETLQADAENMIKSYPFQWQIYGSGPREAWQWVIVAIPAILIMSLGFSLFQTLRFWMAPGEWTQVGGMMMLARRSTSIVDTVDREEKEFKEGKRAYSVTRRSDGKSLLESKAK